jgi:uncharacterized protein YggU (UPF0235/DUF167 family)
MSCGLFYFISAIQGKIATIRLPQSHETDINSRMKKGDYSHCADPNAPIRVRVTPNASRDKIDLRDGVFHITVTATPENGKATAAVQKLLAKALGVAKTDLTLTQGATSRDKTWVLRGQIGVH